jgi:hypothetical protein
MKDEGNPAGRAKGDRRKKEGYFSRLEADEPVKLKYFHSDGYPIPILASPLKGEEQRKSPPPLQEEG